MFHTPCTLYPILCYFINKTDKYSTSEYVYILIDDTSIHITILLDYQNDDSAEFQGRL